MNLLEANTCFFNCTFCHANMQAKKATYVFGRADLLTKKEIKSSIFVSLFLTCDFHDVRGSDTIYI